MSGNYDFRLERTLRERDKHLHSIFTDTVFALQNILQRYILLFPEYTNHSEFHCMNVIEFCSGIIGSQLDIMNADELYVLLMSCYLHDTGMAISQKDYNEFSKSLNAEEYFEIDPSRQTSDFVRDYHNEFSGMFIKKYAGVLEISSPEHLHAIVQVSRGHRRTDLNDTQEYPIDYRIGNGGTICLPYLSALIRLADEVDVIASRNPKLLYDIESLTDEKQILHNKLLAAVPDMEIRPDCFVLDVKTDEPVIALMLETLCGKMQSTLDICRSAVNGRTKFQITQKRIEQRRRKS